MKEKHEILCPPSVGCTICDQEREEINLQKILELIGNNSVAIMQKHFYLLTISFKPTRENYHRFDTEPILKVGRDLTNGLSSVSSTTNRAWWSMFVDAGVKFYSIQQDSDDDFPVFNVNYVFYSNKDNLDVKMDAQLKYRLNKINRNFYYSFVYLGGYDVAKIKRSVKVGIHFNAESVPVKKLGTDVIKEMNRMKELKPSLFGARYFSKKVKNLKVDIE
jgi:hypothetical protein